MRRVDFLISNSGHHASMFAPVVRYLSSTSGQDLEIRIVSLCEFRGHVTPVELFGGENVEVCKLLGSRFREKSTGRQSANRASRLVRRVARSVSWTMLLRRRIEECLDAGPDLVVLPNDAAFPYHRICGLLRDRGIQFLLVQEGIRFPLPNAEGDGYGTHGASAIAAWGENSAGYFRRKGVDDGRIRLTGNPRFDLVREQDWTIKAAQLRDTLGLGRKTLLILTNPIDDQGFCTTKEKLALVRSFLHELRPLFADPEFSVVIKLHGRESEADYQRVRSEVSHADRIHILRAGELYALISLARASVVFASTVGLESLLLGCPLAVLEIPGFGFVHDYVSSGAAEGLGWNGHMAERIDRVFEPSMARRTCADEYVRHNLASLGTATERVAKLILEQI